MFLKLINVYSALVHLSIRIINIIIIIIIIIMVVVVYLQHFQTK